MTSMGKGQVWINGQSIGRYWTAYATGNCQGCHYAGSYRPPKCQLGCGQPTQRYYHVPRSWLKPTDNSLVLFEELGGDPTRISLVKRSTTTVCADMFEYHPNIKDWHIESYGKTQELHRPKVHIHCGPGLTISAIKFASFGTPFGTCGTFQQGTCHAPASYDVIQKVPIIVLDAFILELSVLHAFIVVPHTLIIVPCAFAEVHRERNMRGDHSKQ